MQGHDIPQVGLHGPHCNFFTSLPKNKNKYRNRDRNDNKTRIELENSLKTSTSYSEKKDRRKLVPEHIPAGIGIGLGVGGSGTTRSSNTNPFNHMVPYCERWEDMVDDVNRLFEWAIANRLNKVEWLLLGNYKWGDELETRAKRLKVLTTLGHEYSLMIGADAPIGNIQQHAWHMVNTRSPFVEQVVQIKNRVDWIFNAGFDFLTTESGLSEFTHPECDLMLDLMNTFADYVNKTWGREAGE